MTAQQAVCTSAALSLQFHYGDYRISEMEKNERRIEMAKEVFMCRPCAEKLKAAGRCVMHSPVKDKGECYNCKRRRFGYTCEITKRSRKNEM